MFEDFRDNVTIVVFLRHQPTTFHQSSQRMCFTRNQFEKQMENLYQTPREEENVFACTCVSVYCENILS